MIRLLLLVVLVLAGCATRTPAPVVDRRPAVPGPEMVVIPPPPAPTQEAPVPAPVSPVPEKDWRPELYTIKRGDTLYAIALEHGLDYRELAAMNNIENLNVIRVGQVLRLRPAGEAPAGAAAVPPVVDARPAPVPVPRPPGERGNSDTYKSQPKAIKLPYSDAALAQLQGSASRPESGTPQAPAVAAVIPPPQPPAPAVPPPPAIAAPVPAAPVLPPVAANTGDDRVDWGWPVRGRIISGYSESASLKGIDIGGAAGVPIVASAPGKVVYAGSGLRGYGKLVIVKHNKTFLSAYAHLDQITIREGQTVAKGQELGKMGSTDADQVKLHFEIRSLGKPVDPMRYLPRG